MKPAVYDVTLSSSIMAVTSRILPFTAPGSVMPTALANDLVIELAVLLRLATATEQELAVHRLGEPAGQARKVLEDASTALLSGASRDQSGKVVRVDFTGGQKE
ncbi:hypothetical protein [Shinella kummerowiae]|uniref:hypothetical protein n=1 Tax=Shinella kummerowiae TaxID=417745 RepID=UPI0021B57D5F|nr:hypothetical protein [Shinella kummerowiae]MCT7667647.1 hypothetical protein [Shinella kummerowiae]